MPIPLDYEMPRKNVFLCGATKTGKTSLLVATGKASKGEDVLRDYPGLKPKDYDQELLNDLTDFRKYTPPWCLPHARKEDLGSLKAGQIPTLKGFAKIVDEGQRQLLDLDTDRTQDVGRGISATGGVIEATFHLEVQCHTIRQRAAFGETMRVEICVYDGPGEDLVPSPKADERKTTGDSETGKSLIQLADDADSMILCLNKYWGEDTQRNIGRTLELLAGKAAFRRVILLVTHCDRIFIDDDRRDKARDKALENDSVNLAISLLGRLGRDMLRSVLGADTEIYCGYSSLYGFFQQQPNYDSATQKLLRRGDWQPFGVIDPWRFIVTGHPGRLKRISRDLLTGQALAPAAPLAPRN